MANDKKDLRELLAVDMPNGFTYIGFSEKGVGDRPLILKKGLTVGTDRITHVWEYCKTAKDFYSESAKKEKLEKEIRIDNPGPIHFLGE